MIKPAFFPKPIKLIMNFKMENPSKQKSNVLLKTMNQLLMEHQSFTQTEMTGYCRLITSEQIDGK